MFLLDDILVKIGTNTVVHPISLGFNQSELCMVVGPNGAGKTTLLKTLTGELNPNQGTVLFNNRNLSDWAIKDLARMRAVLPQTSNLEFPFTVRDVLQLGRIPHPTRATINNDIVEQVANLCDCAHLMDRAFPYLSGGEQQRVQIARVLAQVWENDNGQSRFLLLDEPISALDLSHQYSVLKMLSGLAKERNFGIICVLHNLNLATQFAQRCVILDRGRLVADGAPKEVFTEETLSNVFDLDIWIKPHPENPDIPLIIPRLYNQGEN